MGASIIRILAAALLAFSPVVAGAQEASTNRVNSVTDWSVFEGNNPRECWAVTTYKESVNTDSSGNIKSVTRGDILLMVFYRPDGGVSGQVAFTGGYPFASGSTVNMKIGDAEFELLVQDEWAWPEPQDDSKIVAAMKRGANAVLTARSSRGTITRDTFSLLGFTAAVEDAEKRCK